MDRKLTRWFSFSFFYLLFSTFFIIFLCHVCKINLTTSLWLQPTSTTLLSPFYEKGYIVWLSSLFYPVTFPVNLNNLFRLLVRNGRYLSLYGSLWQDIYTFIQDLYVEVGCLPVKSVTQRAVTEDRAEKEISITQKYNNEGKCKHFSEIFGLF